MRQRDSYFDFLRGISIIFVIGIHTMILKDLNFYSLSGSIQILLRQIIGCAVPIFIAISGYFLVQKSIATRKEYFAFLKHQVPIVYYPCLFWSLPYLLIMLKTEQPIILSLFYFLLCGCSIYYFIACIIQCYILLPIVRQKTFGFILGLLAISVIWSFLHVRFDLIAGIDRPLLIYAAPFPNLLVFFALGCWLGHNKKNYSLGLVIVGLLISLALNVYETYYLYDTYNLSTVGMKTTSHIFDFFCILLIFHPSIKTLYKKNQLTSIFEKIGVSSFTIYLTHLLLGIIIYRIPFVNLLWFSKWLSYLVISYLFVRVLKLIIPSKIWVYLGIR